MLYRIKLNGNNNCYSQLELFNKEYLKYLKFLSIQEKITLINKVLDEYVNTSLNIKDILFKYKNNKNLEVINHCFTLDFNINQKHTYSFTIIDNELVLILKNNIIPKNVIISIFQKLEFIYEDYNSHLLKDSFILEKKIIDRLVLPRNKYDDFLFSIQNDDKFKSLYSKIFNTKEIKKENITMLFTTGERI